MLTLFNLVRENHDSYLLMVCVQENNPEKKWDDFKVIELFEWLVSKLAINVALVFMNGKV